MSLKDRLNAPIKQNSETKEENKRQKEQTPKYYESSEIAHLDTLGVLDTLIVDDELNSIFVNGAKNIYLERNGKTVKSTVTFRDNVQLENMIRKNALNIGKELDDSKPFIKFNHKKGINVTATLPPLSNPASIYVKCYKDKHASIQELSENQSISKEIGLILEALCAIKCNILITGEKNTLKTTTLSALSKLLPNNSRGVVVDNLEEFKIESKNYTNYNLSNLEGDLAEIEILNSIIASNPDRLSINSPNEKTLSYIIKNSIEGYRGLITTITAKNKEEALDKAALAILKENINMDFQSAKMLAAKAFDVIIFCKRIEGSKRKITSISEINTENNNVEIKDIFFLNHILEHQSTGYVPNFYETSKINSLPINSNIFEESYKHTYFKSAKTDAMEQFTKKAANRDILKKFKKELYVDNSKEENEQIPELSNEELMKKAQEKFEEIRKNVNIEQNQETEVAALEEIESGIIQSDNE